MDLWLQDGGRQGSSRKISSIQYLFSKYPFIIKTQDWNVKVLQRTYFFLRLSTPISTHHILDQRQTQLYKVKQQRIRGKKMIGQENSSSSQRLQHFFQTLTLKLNLYVQQAYKRYKSTTIQTLKQDCSTFDQDRETSHLKKQQHHFEKTQSDHSTISKIERRRVVRPISAALKKPINNLGTALSLKPFLMTTLFLLLVQTVSSQSPFPTNLIEGNIHQIRKKDTLITSIPSTSYPYLWDLDANTSVHGDNFDLGSNSEFIIVLTSPVVAQTIWLREKCNPSELVVMELFVISSQGVPYQVQNKEPSVQQISRGFFSCTNQIVCSDILQIRMKGLSAHSSDVNILPRFHFEEIGLYKEAIYNDLYQDGAYIQEQVTEEINCTANEDSVPNKWNIMVNEFVPAEPTKSLLMLNKGSGVWCNLQTFFTQQGRYPTHVFYVLVPQIGYSSDISLQLVSSTQVIAEISPNNLSFWQVGISGQVQVNDYMRIKFPKNRTFKVRSFAYFKNEINLECSQVVEPIDTAGNLIPIPLEFQLEPLNSGLGIHQSSLIFDYENPTISSCGAYYLVLSENVYSLEVQQDPTQPQKWTFGFAEAQIIFQADQINVPLKIFNSMHPSTPLERNVKIIVNPQCNINRAGQVGSIPQHQGITLKLWQDDQVIDATLANVYQMTSSVWDTQNCGSNFQYELDDSSLLTLTQDADTEQLSLSLTDASVLLPVTEQILKISIYLTRNDGTKSSKVFQQIALRVYDLQCKEKPVLDESVVFPDMFLAPNFVRLTSTAIFRQDSPLNDLCGLYTFEFLQYDPRQTLDSTSSILLQSTVQLTYSADQQHRDTLLSQAMGVTFTNYVKVNYEGLEDMGNPLLLPVKQRIVPDCESSNRIELDQEWIMTIDELRADPPSQTFNVPQPEQDYCQHSTFLLKVYVDKNCEPDESQCLNNSQAKQQLKDVMRLDQTTTEQFILSLDPVNLTNSQAKVYTIRVISNPDNYPANQFRRKIFISLRIIFPTFENPANFQLDLQKTTSGKLAWKYELPLDRTKIYGDMTYIILSIQPKIQWLSLDEQDGLLSIADLNDKLVAEGTYIAKIQLDQSNDMTDPVELQVTLKVMNPSIFEILEPSSQNSNDSSNSPAIQTASTQQASNSLQSNPTDEGQSEETADTVRLEDYQEEPPAGSIAEEITFNGITFTNWAPPAKVRKEEEKINPPRVTKFKISPVGLLSIHFSKPIIIPSILSRVLFMQDQEAKIKEASNDIDRKLEQEAINQLNSEQILRILISFNVEADESRDLELGSETYAQEKDPIKSLKLMLFKDNLMEVQLEFNKPDQLTADVSQPDLLKLSFNLPKIFIDKNDFERLPETKKIITIEIPPQISKERAKELVKLGQTIENTSQALSAPQIILYTVMAQGLKFLWNVINLLQFLVFMQRYRINLPYETQTWLKFLRALTLFEFLPTKEVINTLSEWAGLDINQSEQAANQGDNLELESGNLTQNDNLFKNMGMMFLIGLALILGIILLLCVRMFIFTDYRVFRAYQRVKQMIFYNSIARYLVQSTLKLLIASFDTLLAAYLTSEDQQLSSLLGNSKLMSPILIIIVLLLCPIIFLLAMSRHESELQYAWIRRRIGTLYLGLNPQRGPVKWHVFVFLIRRILFVAIMYSLHLRPYLQLGALMTCSLVYLTFVNQMHYYEDSLSLCLENFNEAIFLIICYIFILFCNLVQDVQIKMELGQMMLALVLGIIVVNGLFMAQFVVQSRKRNLKIAKIQKWRQAEMERLDKIRQLKLQKQSLNEKLEVISEKSENESSEQSQRAMKSEDKSRNGLTQKKNLTNHSVNIFSENDGLFNPEDSPEFLPYQNCDKLIGNQTKIRNNVNNEDHQRAQQYPQHDKRLLIGRQIKKRDHQARESIDIEKRAQAKILARRLAKDFKQNDPLFISPRIEQDEEIPGEKSNQNCDQQKNGEKKKVRQKKVYELPPPQVNAEVLEKLDRSKRSAIELQKQQVREYQEAQKRRQQARADLSRQKQEKQKANLLIKVEREDFQLEDPDDAKLNIFEKMCKKARETGIIQAPPNYLLSPRTYKEQYCARLKTGKDAVFL